MLLPCGSEFLCQLCPAGSKEASLETLPAVRKPEKLEQASAQGQAQIPVIPVHSLPSHWAELLWEGFSSHSPERG